MKKTLGNPVIGTATATKAAEAIPFVVKLTAVGIFSFIVYRSWSNRFVKRTENPNYPQANVSFAQAEARANSIYSSIGWVSNDFDNVKQQIQGLNYNGYIRVYNAFGKRKGTLLAGELNLEEWLQNQFNQEELNELSFLLNGAFFRQALPTKNNTKTEIIAENKTVRTISQPVFSGL